MNLEKMYYARVQKNADEPTNLANSELDEKCENPYLDNLSKGIDICTPQIFFERYREGGAIVQKLISDLQAVVSDVEWFKESGRENEAIAIDFVDSLNVLSGEI